MFFKKWFLKSKNEIPEQNSLDVQGIDQLFAKTKKSSDFKQYSLSNKEGHLIISYYNTLIDQQQLQRKILSIFRHPSFDINKLKKLRI